MKKYSGTYGQAKINFLALGKKSKSKLLSAYFKDKTSNEKMDNFLDRLKVYKVFKP